VQAVLLAGVVLNGLGALQLLVGALKAPSELAGEHVQLKLFAAGTAAVFASMYGYLYLHPQYAQPFLVFGAALKTWAFVLTLVLYRRGRIELRAFLEFGVSNAIVAAAFWFYLASLGA
jgi:small-conductance mechanosensitive channel